MTEYVLVHARQVRMSGPKIGSVTKKELTVLKNKPAWQKGRLNLVGGKVEPGETPAEAAFRELKEESGLDGMTMPRRHGQIIGVDCIIHCFAVDVSDRKLQPREGETETVEWIDWRSLRIDQRLMPNLRVIIPLLHMGVAGWSIVDQKSSVDVSTHEITVELDIEKPFVNG
jgi:8-oxo-dGTP diphosphatase